MNGITLLAGERRQGPSLLLALATTCVLVFLPLAAATVVQRYASWHALALSIFAGIGVSMVSAWIGTTLWARSTRTGERVFADVTLFGYLRFRRSTRQIAKLERVMSSRDTVTDEHARETMIKLADALERRDLRTHGHSRRVARHAAGIARELGLPDEDVARIRFAAAMHDIGKLNVPPEILFKPDRLTAEEFAVIKQHPIDSANMVKVIADPELLAIIRGHHERWDGRGYPDGLAGATIPYGARVIAVADTFDALVSDRPYRDGMAHRKARQIIAEESGAQFDPEIAAAFKRYYSGVDWHLAWGALAALPPRLGALLLDAFRGALPAAIAAPVVAAVTIGAAAVGGIAPTISQPSAALAAGGSAGSPAVVVNGRRVKIVDGRPVVMPGEPVSEESADGSTAAPGAPGAPGSARGGGEATGDPASKGADVQPEGAPKAPGDAPTSSKQPGGNDSSSAPSGAGGSGSSGGGSGSQGGGSSGTNKSLTDTVGGVVEEVGGTVKDVGGGNKVTDTVGGTVQGVGGVVKGIGKGLTGGK